MQNLLFHVDSRRIHGQVIAGWGFQEKIRRFLLADDEVAADEWERDAYLNTPGPEFETFVESIRQGGDRLRQWTDDKRTMLIVSAPLDARRILELGLRHDLITIGNLEPGAGKQQLTSSVSITASDRQNLLQIIELGVRVVIKPLPQDRPIDVAPLLGR